MPVSINDVLAVGLSYEDAKYFIEHLKPHNMTDTVKKQRAPKTPRNFDSILKGALSLPLNERVALVNKLKESIHAEVETIEAAAEQAKKVMNGL